MSFKGKSDDLFGGLSDSESSDNERDEVLQADDLLQEMAMSCSSEDDNVDDDVVVEKETITITKQADPGDVKDQKELVNEKLTIRKYATSPERASNASKESYCRNGILKHTLTPLNPSSPYMQRKRKVHISETNDAPEEARKKSDDVHVSLDSLDAVTTLIDSAPKLPKQAKRSKKSLEPIPAKVNAVVSQIEPTNKPPLPMLSCSSVPLRIALLKSKNPLPVENKPKITLEKTEDMKQLEHLVLLGNFSKEQLERYEVYRRSTFNKTIIRKTIEKVTGTSASDQLVIAIRSLAKMLVGELVEEAVELRQIRNETDKPIQPHHIKIVFKDLVSQGKLWPPYGSKA